MKVQACAWGLLLLLSATALAAPSGKRLTLVVTPLQSFAPTNLTVRVHLTPDANNRRLEVSADSGEYFRSSSVQLDGKEAPQTITVELRSLPGGQYEIRGVLVDSSGRACAYAHQQANVLPALGGD